MAFVSSDSATPQLEVMIERLELLVKCPKLPRPGVQEDAQRAVAQPEPVAGLGAGELEGVAGVAFVEGVEGADEDDDVVRQAPVLSPARRGAHVGDALVVAAASGKLPLVSGLHLHVKLGGGNPSTRKRGFPPPRTPSFPSTA